VTDDSRVVLWDFDGTLAWRPGGWAGCLLEVLDEHAAGHGGTLEQISGAIRGGFPWDRHEDSHTDLSSDDAWWNAVSPLLVKAIEDTGVEQLSAKELAPVVRHRFTDGARVWQAFEDSLPALAATADAGWRNVILSNHVPELPTLVMELGLNDAIEIVFTSGSSGYEKPHPEAFRHALEICGQPSQRWMVGDNPIADVEGAEAVGIPAVLVRREAKARYTASDAAAAALLVTRSTRGVA
jgi:putative hydrolase of the HAD superfamily